MEDRRQSGSLAQSSGWMLPSERRRLAEGSFLSLLPGGELPQKQAGILLAKSAWSVRGELDRRDFMLASLGGLSLALMGVLSAAPIGRFLALPPALNVEGRKPPGWVEIGRVADFDATPKRIDYAGEHTVYVYLLQGKLVALSAVCQHLGCTVEWRPTADPRYKAKFDRECEHPLFCCPCHFSEYDITGKVFTGSPAYPKNLIPQKIKVEKGKVFLGGDPKEWKRTEKEGSSLLDFGVKV